MPDKWPVCVYDRAGRGWSDPAATPPDGAQIATDLHTLLDRAHVPGPYVLVGHSFGGLYVQTYAAKYPREVAGLVLVDSTAPENDPVSPPEPDAYSIVKHVSSLFGTTARLGLGRLLASTSYSELPPRYRDDARATATATATAATGEEMAGVLAEYGVASRSTDEAGTLRSLGAKPLIVLTATRGNREGARGGPRLLRGRPGPRRLGHPGDPRRRRRRTHWGAAHPPLTRSTNEHRSPAMTIVIHPTKTGTKPVFAGRRRWGGCRPGHRRWRPPDVEFLVEPTGDARNTARVDQS